jgi:putative hydrolase of the HAD superfamily
MPTVEGGLNSIKAIVFDLDDTLYPQVAYKRSGFKVVSGWLASQFGLRQSSVLAELENILIQFGPSYPFMFDRLAERISINAGLVPEMVRVFIEHEPRINCYEGVIPMLSRLRRQYHLGILTDGRYTVQQKKVMALGLGKKVDRVLYSDMLGLEKPAIELFKWFEDKFELRGQNLLYVGDNPKKDFLGANQRSWSTVQVLTGEVSETKNENYLKAINQIQSAIQLENCLLEPC